jgi:hypothetical protein
MTSLSHSFDPLNRFDPFDFFDHSDHSDPFDSFDPLECLDHYDSSNPLDDSNPFTFLRCSLDFKPTSVTSKFVRIIMELVSQSGIAPTIHYNMVFS